MFLEKTLPFRYTQLACKSDYSSSIFGILLSAILFKSDLEWWYIQAVWLSTQSSLKRLLCVFVCKRQKERCHANTSTLSRCPDVTPASVSFFLSFSSSICFPSFFSLTSLRIFSCVVSSSSLLTFISLEEIMSWIASPPESFDKTLY